LCDGNLRVVPLLGMFAMATACSDHGPSNPAGGATQAASCGPTAVSAGASAKTGVGEMTNTSRKFRSIPAFVLLSSIPLLWASNVSAATNQFRGVNWADSRDNFQSGVLYISGLSSSDTYASALATGNAIMGQFVSKLGANAVRMPINEATVSTYWSTYQGAIDAVLSKGMVVLCYWDSGKTNKPPDMNAFWSMWKTVVDKYGSNANAYFEIFNEPNMYSKSDLVSLYGSWLTQFSTVPKSRVILDGTGNAQNVPDIGSASSLDGCLLAVHDYSFFGSDTWTTESQWVSQFKGEVGSYSDRTVCTEWGGPMSPGSKNGVSYDYLDYSKTPTNYFEAYIRGISSQLCTWNMGSFYWPGLRDGDWYSMTTKSGSGSDTTLSIPNQSGLDRLHASWCGATGTGGSGGVASGGATSTGGAAAAGGRSSTGGSAAAGVSAVGGGKATGGSVATTGGNAATTGGREATGGTSVAPNTGGTTAISATGGRASTGGANSATGGTVAMTGGAPSTGGAMGLGGQPGTGGAVAVGGAPLSGGSVGTTEVATTTTDTGTANTNDTSNSGSCGCRVVGGRSKSLAIWGVFGVAVFGSLRRRLSRRGARLRRKIFKSR
jgi:MYXO-CTERM domain-containing protein